MRHAGLNHEASFYGKNSAMKINARQMQKKAGETEVLEDVAFFEIANVLPEKDSNGNNQFDWANSINVKLGQEDVAKILEFFYKNEPKTTLYHETTTTKSIDISSVNGRYNFRFGVKGKEDNAQLHTATKQLSYGQMLMLVDILRYGFLGML